MPECFTGFAFAWELKTSCLMLAHMEDLFKSLEQQKGTRKQLQKGSRIYGIKVEIFTFDFTFLIFIIKHVRFSCSLSCSSDLTAKMNKKISVIRVL